MLSPSHAAIHVLKGDRELWHFWTPRAARSLRDYDFLILLRSHKRTNGDPLLFRCFGAAKLKSTKVKRAPSFHHLRRSSRWSVGRSAILCEGAELCMVKSLQGEIQTMILGHPEASTRLGALDGAKLAKPLQICAYTASGAGGQCQSPRV